MRTLIALLRAVNVGGTGKLPMAELCSMAKAAGFDHVRTCIQSGNLVFSSADSPFAVKLALEKQLEKYAQKPVGVVVRTAHEIRAVLEANPFTSQSAYRGHSSSEPRRNMTRNRASSSRGSKGLGR